MRFPSVCFLPLPVGAMLLAYKDCCHMQAGMRLQKELFEFTPAATGLPIKYINLLLFGGVGAGKSSIVSTVDSLCQGRVSRRAPHGQGTGSLTRNLRKYTFIDPDSNRKVQWQLWDIMGWSANNYHQWQIDLMLDGHIPDRGEPDGAGNWRSWRSDEKPSIAHAVHCMCLVIPCDAASDDAYMGRFREVRQIATNRGECYL